MIKNQEEFIDNLVELVHEKNYIVRASDKVYDDLKVKLEKKIREQENIMKFQQKQIESFESSGTNVEKKYKKIIKELEKEKKELLKKYNDTLIELTDFRKKREEAKKVMESLKI